MKNKFKFLILLFSAIMLSWSCTDDDSLAPADADDNFITALSLSVDDTTYIATIEGQSIIVAIPYNITLTSAVATIEYTESATISPDPNMETIDWNREQVFTVTSYNGDTNEYTYSITRNEIEEKGDVYLQTMSEIEAFYEKGTTVVDGNLIIGTDDGEEITSLEKLSNLKSISGNLVLKNSFSATDLTGLEQVTKIGGLYAGTQSEPSTAVLNYVSMPNLTEVTGDISVWNNNLKWVELKALNKAGGISLASEIIENIEFPSLTEVESDFIVEGCLEREFTDGRTSGYDPPAMKGNMEFFSMPNLQNVGGTLGVNFVATLETISLAKLETAGNINFEYLPMLFETIDLSALHTVSGFMKICSSKIVATIGISTTYNEALTSLGDLSKLEQVGGVLTISNFELLSEISLPSLKQSGGIWLEELMGVENLFIPNVTFTAPEGEELATLYIGTCHSLGTLSTPNVLNAKLHIHCPRNTGTAPVIPCFEDKTTIAEVYIYDEDVNTLEWTFTNWEKVEGNFCHEIYSDNAGNAYSFPDMKEVGGYLSIACTATGSTTTSEVSVFMPELESVGGQLRLFRLRLLDLNFSSLKTVCCADEPAYYDQEETARPTGSLYIRSRNNEAYNMEPEFPVLTRVGGRGLVARSVRSLSCPLLTEIDGTLTMDFAYGSISDIYMPNLEKISGCYFNDSSNFDDFTFFGKFIDNGMITEENWYVTGCAYNPTYQDMVEGRYTAETAE